LPARPPRFTSSTTAERGSTMENPPVNKLPMD
jgi:hypothetical protein